MAAPESPVLHPRAPRILLANINRGELSTVFVIGVLDAMIHGTIIRVALGESGPYLDRGRNRIVSYARSIQGDADDQVDWDWLLFVDSDIEFNHAHVETLLTPTLDAAYDPTRFPILSGVYHNPFDDEAVPGEDEPTITDAGPAGHVGPVVYEWVERRFPDMPDDHSSVMAFRRLSRAALATLPPVNHSWNPRAADHAPTPSPVCEVAAVGCGFLAIHTSLLDKFADTFPLPLPFFDEPVVNTVHLGEDLAFCHRARSLGYPVLVNRACVVLHHKTMKLA